MSPEQIGEIVLYCFSAGTFLSILAALYCKHHRGWSNEGVIAAIFFWPVLWGVGIVALVVMLLGWIICTSLWLADFPIRYSAWLFRKPVPEGMSFRQFASEFFDDGPKHSNEELFERIRRAQEQGEDEARGKAIIDKVAMKKMAAINTNGKKGIH